MEFQITREIPKSLNAGAIERAVEQFVHACQMEVDWTGFFNQTLQKIAASTYMQQPGQDFWLAHENGEVAGYALGSVSIDIDNRLTYWVAQSWVDPLYRGHPIVKESWQQIRKRARDLMCAHLMIVSCRNAKAECRWLGEGMDIYGTILKQDLNPEPSAAVPMEAANGSVARNNQTMGG